MATAAVHKYLQNQNRPYSANDIVTNLHKEYGKGAVQKALDELVSQNKIIEKVYGKQKVYCVLQEDENTDPEAMRAEIAKMDKEIMVFTDTLQTNEQKIKNAEHELKNLQSSLTNEQAKAEVSKLEKESEKLKEKLKVLSENSVPISPEQKLKAETEHNKYMKEFRKRRRMCTDIIDSILEGYPKRKKDLVEEIGIETDEEVGCTIK